MSVSLSLSLFLSLSRGRTLMIAVEQYDTKSQVENNYITEMCSASETGSYLRLIDCVYHSPLAWKVIKKKRRRRITKPGPQSGPAFFICKVKAVRTLYAFPFSPRSGSSAHPFSLFLSFSPSLSLAHALSLSLVELSRRENLYSIYDVGL